MRCMTVYRSPIREICLAPKEEKGAETSAAGRTVARPRGSVTPASASVLRTTARRIHWFVVVLVFPVIGFIIALVILILRVLDSMQTVIVLE